MEEEKIDLNELIDIYNQLTTRQLELKAELKSVEEKIKELDFYAEKELDRQEKDIITIGYWSIGYKKTTKNVFNSKKFQEEHKDLYEQYKEEKEYKKVCFGHIN